MPSRFPVVALFAAAAALFLFAFAVAPAMIGSPENHSIADTPHSWVADAFPTGQAGFARFDGARR